MGKRKHQIVKSAQSLPLKELPSRPLRSSNLKKKSHAKCILLKKKKILKRQPDNKPGILVDHETQIHGQCSKTIIGDKDRSCEEGESQQSKDKNKMSETENRSVGKQK